MSQHHQNKPAPAQDEREAFKRALHSQRVFKLSSATINAAEWAWFARPAQTEQQPVCWASSTALVKLRNGRNNSPCVLTDGPAEFNDTPLYVIAQTEQPEQSGLVEALEAIVRQYPNPDISHVDYRVHACRQAEQALDAYRAALPNHRGGA